MYNIIKIMKQNKPNKIKIVSINKTSQINCYTKTDPIRKIISTHKKSSTQIDQSAMITDTHPSLSHDELHRRLDTSPQKKKTPPRTYFRNNNVWIGDGVKKFSNKSNNEFVRAVVGLSAHFKSQPFLLYSKPYLTRASFAAVTRVGSWKTIIFGGQDWRQS